METYPLIRRPVSFKTILSMITGKIFYRPGKTPSRPISIPKIVPPSRAAYRSLLTEESGLSESPEVNFSGKNLLKVLGEPGLTGRGGAAFPVNKKIEAVKEATVEKRIYIINAVECDPGLLHDAWILEHRRKEIVQIVELMKELIPFEKVLLAVKPEKASLRLEETETVVVGDTYPAGEERLLVKTLLGIDIPRPSYPASRGILVQNVQTLVSMYHALQYPEGAKIRYLTMINRNTEEGMVIQAKAGTPVRDMVSSVYPGASEIFLGGGIMQARRANEAETLTDEINCIILGDSPPIEEKTCGNCYQCNIHCPAGLDIRAISSAVREERIHELPDTVDPENCMQCGVCTYVCPAGIDLCSDCRSLINR